ncbi:MAG: endonuclease MutS2 [Anaerolineales bacterium]|nr:MAG: endonuclease MutS2 [Anaerolineales bacterium]
MSLNKHLYTLEFPKILERLARQADFSASKELALGLVPAFYLPEVCEMQSQTSEARRLLGVKPDVSIGGARDVRPLLGQASRSAALLPNELLDIRQTLVAARHVKQAISRLADQFPRLADIVGRIQECPELVQEISRSISDRGEVLDTASSALARVRSELEVAHQRLLDRLQRIVQSPHNSQYLQETFVTQRQGRYVIPLRAEFKGRIRGIVHDQSASGATLFIEPLATVELNNRWYQLQLDEEEEVRRVLLALTELVAQESKYIAWSVEALAELDLAFAKAKYADELDAVEPEWVESAGASIRLLAARHPLLDPETVVPVDVDLPPKTFMLVITGPNTGGKTVTLKTVGLLVAMAQAGLHIPAAKGSILPLFRGIYADMGDEQSIEQSLSTFSSHLTNIVSILAECDDKSLVVLDELGAGTDPVEGWALARAILEHLREHGVTTFVATHYSELKAYAHTTPGVTNASVEFDAETLAPTYRLTIGLPGRSNAFAIARRLGLDESVIQVAQDVVSPEALQTEAMLRDIQAQLDAGTRERATAEAIRVQVEARLGELNQRLANIDKERREILNSAHADARREIEAVRQELRRLRQEWAVTPPLEGKAPLPVLEKKAEAELATLEATVGVEEAPLRPEPKYRGPLQAGDQVWVEPYQAVGEVISSRRGEVEVQLGRFRATVKRNQVELHERAVEAETPPGEGGAEASDLRMLAVDSPGLELDLRGLTTEEALPRLDLYLDNAYLVGLPWVRIIHGKGTGVLRAAVRDALQDHPLVASCESGKDGEGGDGVTVAKLAVE